MFDELRPDQLPTIMPLLPISSENAVAEEGFPVLMELLSLAKILELSGKDSLDVLRIGGEDPALPYKGGLNGFAMFLWRPCEEPLQEVNIGVVVGVMDVATNDIDAKGKV